MECIKYPSIDQFKNAIKDVSAKARYQGKDEEGNPIFDRTATLPTLTFTATVKIHGTNASVRLDADGSYHAQSRERVLTLTQDNAGFYIYANQHKDFFAGLMQPYLKDNDSVVIYGEWAGKGVQKGVAVSELDKKFFIFGVRTVKGEETEWYPVDSIDGLDQELKDFSAYRITTFPVWKFDIDFNNPHSVQNQLVDLCNAVENECPVGKFFGVSGVGEGIVLTHISPEYGRITFKVKGEKHSNSKVKTIAPVDEEAFKAAKDFANNFVTDARLNQGIQVLTTEHLLDMNDPKNIGAFLKWISQDIFKEEEQNIIQNALDPKKVAREIQTIARNWFLNRE